MFLGICLFGTISKKRNISWEVQLFAKVRDYSDGVDFLNFKIQWDRYECDHSPSFKIELDFLNIHNSFWIYKTNPH